ncbi:TIM barrel protein [Sphingomonas adhaesiva]|uniref:TIM barrel protein n=1 Tax=Sphingomonas adhaesiva TaxID=28212 RepID=UPI002FF7467E
MASRPQLRFSVNHITVPKEDLAGLAALTRDLGFEDVEIRNDVAGQPLADGTPGTDARVTLDAGGVSALTVNALQRFNEWNDERAAQAEAIAAETAASGAPALVLCPVNEDGWRSGDGQRASSLREALTGLKPILDRHGLQGFVEPLGFPISSLRYKRDAVEAIDAVGGADTFLILHDTFHHAIAQDPDLFPDRTGLIHVSGVSSGENLAFDDMLDAHRILVDEDDALDSVGQIAALIDGGYSGAISFECFATSVHDDPAVADAIARSAAFIVNSVGTAS